MATVTVFTAARMQEIEDTAITFAYLDGDDLILRRHNMATINVGSVRGPKGDKGDTGEVSEAELDAAIAAERASGKPWNSAWGVVASAVQSAAVTGATSGNPKVLTGADVTFTSVAGRQYKISGKSREVISTSGGFRLYIFRTLDGGSPANIDVGQQYTGVTTIGTQCEAFGLDSPGAGTCRFYLQLGEWWGGSHSAIAGSSRIIVEDVGPA